MSNKLFLLFSKNKSYFLFSFLKYIEYAITAILFFHLANRLSPNSYGSAASSFLVITYSSFFVIGINQVLVKWYSNVCEYHLNIFLFRYFLLYISLFSFIAFISVYNLLDYKYAFYVSLICSFKLIIEGAASIFRVKEKALFINYINISTSFIFVVLYYFYVTSIEDFFKIWSLCLFFGVLFSIYSLKKIKVFSDVLINFNSNLKFYDWLRLNLIKLLGDGFKLAGITILGTLFNSIDRIFFINIYDLPSVQMGNILLAENISNLLNIGIGSYLFVVTPVVITRIRNSSISIFCLYRKSIFIMILFSASVLFLIQPLTTLVTYFFPDYNFIRYPLFFSLIYKLLNLGFFVPGIVSIINNSEGKYIKIGIFWLFFNAATIFILSYFIEDSSAFYIIPVINTIFLIILHFNYYIVYSSRLLQE